MKLDNNHLAFYALVQAGLWEKDVLLSQYGQIDFNVIYRLAEEQTVVGLVVAGLEHISDIKVPQAVLLNFVGNALQIERRNVSMNDFINKLMSWLENAGIFMVLVKGQGVAQCYERPLWRACGDIDLLLSSNNYERAKDYLIPLAVDVETEYKYFKHVGMTLQGWVVELHGTLQSMLSKKIDKEIDNIREGVINLGDVRVWQNDNTVVYLPSPDADVIFLFTHFLNHFYKGGLGLRQICDWCRLLWTFKDNIRKDLLAARLKKMGLLTEWKTFSALAVDYLGMPAEALPFYEASEKWSRKANRIIEFLLEVGNFGHNRDSSYYAKYPLFQRKAISFWRRIKDIGHHVTIFPLDSIRFLIGITMNGFKTVIHGINEKNLKRTN